MPIHNPASPYIPNTVPGTAIAQIIASPAPAPAPAPAQPIPPPPTSPSSISIQILGATTATSSYRDAVGTLVRSTRGVEVLSYDCFVAWYGYSVSCVVVVTSAAAADALFFPFELLMLNSFITNVPVPCNTLVWLRSPTHQRKWSCIDGNPELCCPPEPYEPYPPFPPYAPDAPYMDYSPDPPAPQPPLPPTPPAPPLPPPPPQPPVPPASGPSPSRSPPHPPTPYSLSATPPPPPVLPVVPLTFNVGAPISSGYTMAGVRAHLCPALRNAAIALSTQANASFVEAGNTLNGCSLLYFPRTGNDDNYEHDDRIFYGTSFQTNVAATIAAVTGTRDVQISSAFAIAANLPCNSYMNVINTSTHFARAGLNTNVTPFLVPGGGCMDAVIVGTAV